MKNSSIREDRFIILLDHLQKYSRMFPKPPSSSQFSVVTYWMSYKFNSILTPVFPEVASEPTGQGSLPQDCLLRSQSRARNIRLYFQISMVIVGFPTPPPPVRSSPGMAHKAQSISCHLPVCAKDMIKDTDEQVDEEARRVRSVGSRAQLPSCGAGMHTPS